MASARAAAAVTLGAVAAYYYFHRHYRPRRRAAAAARRFHRDGIAVVRGFASASECREMLASMDALVEAWTLTLTLTLILTLTLTLTLTKTCTSPGHRIETSAAAGWLTRGESWLMSWMSCGTAPALRTAVLVRVRVRVRVGVRGQG